ncbi:MAG: tetratricopeptide repeat protein [Planctomycetes bacterium]|nr:tetratricopeptide repeat protein [Planctomycetota bacterium]
MGLWVRALLLLSALAGGAVAAHEDLEIQIARLSRQIELEPGRAILHFRRGELHRMHEDWKAARADLERAASCDPEMAVVDLALGRLANQSGDPGRAKASLDRFLAREPGHGEALIERARARARLGDRAGAVEDYSLGLTRLEEPRPENFIERSEILRSEGRRDEALRGLEEGLRKIGPVLPLQLALIDLELEVGKVDAALARLEDVARTSERQDLWLARRGDILVRAGRAPEAARAFRAALASIEALPSGRRKTKFTQDLESRVRAALETIK